MEEAVPERRRRTRLGPGREAEERGRLTAKPVALARRRSQPDSFGGAARALPPTRSTSLSRASPSG